MKNEDREQSNTKPYIIMVVILMIISLIIIAILLLNSKNEPNEKQSGESKKIGEIEKNNKEGKASFFALQNMVNTFVSYNSSESIYNLLYSDYINENGITNENAFDIIRKNHYNLIFRAQSYSNVDMSDVNKNIYIVNGILIENGMETMTILDEDYSVVLLLDYENFTFNVIPDTSEIPKYLSSKKTFTIEKNNLNSIPTTSAKSRYDYCELYYNDFVFKVNYLPEDAMEYLSDNDKISIKQSDIEKMFIGSSAITECSYDSDIRVYTIIDSKENNIRIKENSIMDYTVYLK